MKKYHMFEEVWEARKQAIKEADERKMQDMLDVIHDKKKVRKAYLAVSLVIFLSLVLAVGLFFLIQAIQEPKIEYRVVEKVVERQPIIQNYNNTYVQETKYNSTVNNVIVPKDSANCIKVFSKDNPDNFVLNCEKVR